MNTTIKALKIWKNAAVVCGLLFTLCMVSCGNEKDAEITPGSGLISLSGGAPFPFTMSTVAIATSGTFSTITLTNSTSLLFGNTGVRTIKISVPINVPVVGVPIQLDKNSTLVETTLNSNGGTLSTDFTSKTAKGSIFLNSFAPTVAAGTYQVVFTDAAFRTRAVFNGTIAFGS